MKEYRHSIFSIRKLSIGVVSLCIGTGLFLSSLTGLQVEASERIATSNQEIHFHYLLEEELSSEEKSRIVQQLPEDLRQEATYFLVYRPQSPKVLPATGEFVYHAAAWLAAGFIVLAIQTMGSKKARVVSLLYVTLAGAALPLLQVEALQSHALAHYNQTVKVKAGDLLPDGKLELASYDFVGYIIEDGKVGQTVSTEKIVEQPSKQSDLVDPSPANQTVSPEKELSSEQVQAEEGPGLQPFINYREEKIPLEIERIEVEDPDLALGEVRLEAGHAGYRIHRYEESWLGERLQSSRLLETKEVAGKPEILYRGTKTTAVQEEVTQVPSHSPQTAPPVRLDFQLKERVDRQVLPISEERIETDRLAQGETEVEEGREGLLEITYQDVIVAGQVIASNELHRQETASISRKVYVGTRETEGVPEQPSETLIPSHSPQTAPPVRLDFQLKERVDRQVLSIPEERIETDRLAQGETEVEEGREGLLEITYQDVIVAGQVIASNELHRQEAAPISRKVYVGTRVDSKEVPPLTHSQATATLVSEEVSIPFERSEAEDPEMAQGTSRVEPGQDGLALVTYAELDGVRTLLTSEEIHPSRSQVTYHGSRVDSKEVPPLTHSQATATLVSEEVSIPFERSEAEDPEMAQGTSRVEPGQDGLALVTYAELDGVRTLLTSEEIHPSRSQVTYHGSRVEDVVLEEELPLVERIIEIADQYTDYIRIEQAGYPGRRRTVSRNGQVISEETQAGQERIIHKGIKPIEGSLIEEEPRSIAFRTIYQADPALDFGRREEFDGQSGQEVIAITYRTIKGQKTEELGRERVEFIPPVDKVVRVGTKPTEEIIRESLPTRYEADETAPVGQESPVSSGREKVIVYQTTYTVDEETGIVTSHRGQGQIRETGEAPLIRKGTKPALVTQREPLPLIYQADTNLPITSVPIRQEGRDKVTTITTTYTLNPTTGEVTANAPVSAVTDEGEATIVRVGAQPTVQEESQTLPTIYRAREDKELPYREEVVQGQARRIRYQTNYVVDPQTGNRTAQEEIPTVLDQGRAAEVEVGTKATLVRETILHRVIRQDDMDLPIGEEIEGPVGQDGSITRITSYRLDERTGQIESLPVQVEEIPAIDQVIRVGRKVVEVPPKPLEKPNVVLGTVTYPAGLVVNETILGVDVYYRVTDPDKTLEAVQLAIYNGEQLVNSIEQTTEFAVENQLQLRDLQAYMAYQARLSFRYRTQDGQAEELVTTIPFDINPKSIEFNRVSQRELFVRTPDGRFQQVTGLQEVPSDLSNYFVRYKSADAKEFLWAVHSIVANGNQFDVAVQLPKLVQARNQADANVLENLDQFQLPKISLAQDSYADFQQLIQAMKARPEGTFKLAADLVASPTTDSAYVENFRGRLEGLDGQVYRILNLQKPLFQTMTGAQVEHILLENVALQGGDSQAAALAVTANNSRVQDVHVTGQVQSYVGAAGLVYEANNSQFDSVSFKGELVLNEHRTGNQITSGGLIGKLMSGSALRKAYVHLTSTFAPRLSMQDRLGAVVGYALLSTIDSVFVEGEVTNREQTGTVAGLVAGGYSPIITRAASALTLPETGLLVGTRTPLPLTVQVQENRSTSRVDNGHQVEERTAEELKQLLSSWGLDGVMQPIQATNNNQTQPQSRGIDYHLLRNGRIERKLAYENMAKLLPFYDRHTIVRMGNQLADDSVFVTKSIQSIQALRGKEVVVDFTENANQVDRLLVYFTDQAVQVFDLTYQGAYDQTGVLEYSFGPDLLFTPYQWVNGQNRASLVTNLRQALQDLDIESDAYALKTKMADYLSELRFKHGKQDLTISMKQLYLKRTQEALKVQLNQEVGSLLASQWVTDSASPVINAYMQQQVEDNKESIWLALTYLARYYGIDFDSINLRNLAIYQPHFYGQSLTTLDWLKEVGGLTYKDLAPFAAASNFKKTIGQQVPGTQNLFDYLELNRRLFSPDKTDADWFKQSSKAFIHEEASVRQPEKSVQVYDQLKNHADYHRYVLPLLNLPEEDQLYLVSLANVLVFGSYGRYVDHQLQTSQPDVYRSTVRDIQENRIPKHARIWNAYMEFIKSLVSDQARQAIESKLVTVREGYNIKDPAGQPLVGTTDRRRWAAEFGDDYRIIDDFFGPTELYYGTFNKSGAADFEFKKYIIYGNVDLLTPTGNSTFTHEMTHILEDQILNLAGRRQGQESESYALGLLQSIASANAYYYGFNLTEELAATASHNSSPNRLTSKDDLQGYLKGSFDTTYFLDALEAEELLKLQKDQQKKAFRKIELQLEAAYQKDGQTYQDALDRIRVLTDSEWQTMNLTTVEDLVTNNLQLANTINNVGSYYRDNDRNYYFVPLYYPIYAGLLNNQGTVGGLQFRRTALELLAEKGWDQGFLPYVSNQLAEEAHANGRALTDSYIWQKIMPDYQDYADFKKARYRTSLEQKNNMKSIQILWDGRHHDLQTGQDIQVLMQAAIREDLANQGTSFKRQQLKEALYKAFHEVSQEFRESIFLLPTNQPIVRNLEPRFELKSISGAELLHLENGSATPVLALSQRPSDLRNYVAKFTSDQHQPVYLPVAAIQEVEEGGQSYFKVIASWEDGGPRERSAAQSQIPTFFVAKSLTSASGQAISSFQDLLNRIEQNTSGRFVLTQDLYVQAQDLPTGEAYISPTFSGQLDGQGFAIYGLQAPLFKVVTGQVTNLHLKEVRIDQPKSSSVGSLAKDIRGGQIDRVHVTGSIRAGEKIGGLAAEVYANARLSSVSFTGQLISAYTGSQNNFVGGIAGWLGSGSQLRQAQVSAEINAYSSSLRAGGLVGQAENAGTRIQTAFAQGAVYTTQGSDSEAGGLIGSVPENGQVILEDAVTAVEVFNGKRAYGFATDSSLKANRIAYLDQVAAGKDQTGLTALAADQVAARLQELGLSAQEDTQGISRLNRKQVDYLALPDARRERLLAYHNIAKLLPLMASDMVIAQANQLADQDDLVKKTLVAVLPMVDNQFVFDAGHQKDAINRLLLHFDDHSLTYHDLEKVQEFSDLAIVEYRLVDKGISYTSQSAVNKEQLDGILQTVLPALQAVEWNSTEIRKALGLSSWESSQTLAQLQLSEAFASVKTSLAQDLRDLLAVSSLTYQNSPAYQNYLTDYLLKNKAELVLGLAYLHKWYALPFGQTSIRDLVIKKGDFFGRPVDSLQQVIEIGSLGHAFLKPKQNALVAKKVLAQSRMGGDLFTFLDAYRQTFLPAVSTNDWFKQTSKARIIETYSTIEEARAKQTQSPTGVFHNTFFEKMADPNWSYKELALILLHLPQKELFVLTDMTNTVIGTYARYQNPDQLDGELDSIAKRWAAHADFWYSVLPTAHKDKMFKRVLTWDSRYFGDNWADSRDSHLSVVRNFYAPMELDYTVQTGSNAYSDLTDIYFMGTDIRGMEGARVYSHEMVHVADDDTYLLGHGRRAGMGLESFAQGLFQSNTWFTQDNFSLNTIMDYGTYIGQSPGKLLTNSSPSRFTSPEDLQTYMKHYMDLIYSMDYLEAEAVLQSPNQHAKANWFNRMTTFANNHTQIQQVSSTLTSFNDLLEQGLVSRRSYAPWSGTSANEFHNAYLDVNALNPLFAATGNDGTSRNEYEFRKIAFELLAEKGYEAGFVPYVSNQHGQELTGSSSAPMADSALLARITGNQYSNILDFRKAMFERRRLRLDDLRSVRILGRQEGGYFHGPSQTVSSIGELRSLMAAAVAYDASHGYYSSQTPGYSPEKSAVYSLKAALLNAFLQETEEFRQGIYRS
ncbi:TPA: ZmpA/ZmpB/ZmpC family metallo-endopeptidase [Streptococcus suis]